MKLESKTVIRNNGAAGLAIDLKTIHPMDRKSDRLLTPADADVDASQRRGR